MFSPSVPPQLIITLNQSVTAERGSVVNLTCAASGDPTPSYKWTKDGSTIDESAEFENDKKTLILKNVTPANDGVYTCWAINEAGNDSTTTNLTVHGMCSW